MDVHIFKTLVFRRLLRVELSAHTFLAVLVSSVVVLPWFVRGSEVIFAINCGGDAHVDVNNIHYKKDPLQSKIGTASDYGKQLVISRVPRADQILYQTERYHRATFGYEFPVNRDGDYVLVMKFSEVYFSSAGKKVFDVVLNGVHTVVSDLDIYAKVGKAVAHDEYVSFKVKGNKLLVNGEESVHDGKIKVDFVKGYKDNPKVNALYVMMGTIADVPQLPPLQRLEEREEEEEEVREERKASSQIRKPSGPRSPNPYNTDETSMMLPIFVAVGAFIPLLFCLCKL